MWLWTTPTHVSLPNPVLPGRIPVTCGAPMASVWRTPNPDVEWWNTPSNAIPGVDLAQPPTGLDPRCVATVRRRVGEGAVLAIGAASLVLFDVRRRRHIDGGEPELDEVNQPV